MTNDFSSLSVRAQTHPAAYRLHKYWARKPHNVVRQALQALGVGPGRLVVDPCCGSGVPLSEAAHLGATVVGFDVNPVAVELTRTTLDPPSAEQYREAINAVIDELEHRYGPEFEIGKRRTRYAVHATIVACPGCHQLISADRAERCSRRYRCPSCQHRLAFNLENLVATRELHAMLDDGTRVELDTIRETRTRPASTIGDRRFTPNPRILAFPGMRTHDLFSERTFAVLATFAASISTLPAALRPVARLTLTGSVAQCSRLVAYRNGLSTGGPAWTVPGFWVPPVHLETNPLVHLRQRARRVEQGLLQLAQLHGRGTRHEVHGGDAARLLDRGVLGQRRVSLVFFDPPYGDSVPYLEFSTLWNSFLADPPDPGLDIAVSDRDRGDATWERYQQGLTAIVNALRPALADGGAFLVTFNNKDLRAWRSLLAALQGAGLSCRGAFYQHPAVVSTKAQLARGGSYVGDIYAHFAPSPGAPRDGAAARRALLRALPATSSSAPAERQRMALLELLRANLSATVVDDLPELLDDRAR